MKPNLILRPIALLLIPCLAGEPALTNLGSEISDCGSNGYPSEIRDPRSKITFASQALALPAGASKLIPEVEALHHAIPQLNAPAAPANQIENTAENSPDVIDRSMLGDLLEDPVVQEGLPIVKSALTKPENLRYGMLVYRHDPALFHRLVEARIPETVIENIGHALEHRSKGALAALKAGLPFTAPWIARRSKGWTVLAPTPDLFEEHPNLAARMFDKGWLKSADQGPLVLAGQHFWEETVYLIDERHWSLSDARLYGAAQALRECPDQTRSILDYFGALPPPAWFDGDTMLGCARLMKVRGIAIERLIKIIHSLGFGKWRQARFEYRGQAANFTEPYLAPFLDDEAEARRWHRRFPFSDGWTRNWSQRSTPAGRRLLSEGFPLERLSPAVLQAFEANETAFNALWHRTSPMAIETSMTSLIKADFTRENISAALAKMAVLEWLTPLMERELLRQCFVKLLTAGEALPEAFSWTAERLQSGELDASNFLNAIDVFLSNPLGARLAWQAGIPAYQLSEEIARDFAKGQATGVARTWLAIYQRRGNLPLGLAPAILDSPGSVQALKAAGTSAFDLNDAATLRRWEQDPRVLKIFARLLRCQGLSAAQMGFSDHPFDFTVRIAANSEFDRVQGRYVYEIRIALNLSPDEVAEIRNTLKIRKLGEHTSKPAAAYVVARLCGNGWIIEEIQSDLLDGELSGGLQERYRNRYEVALRTAERVLDGSPLLIQSPSDLLRRWSAISPKTAYRLYAELPAHLGYHMERITDRETLEAIRNGTEYYPGPWFWTTTDKDGMNQFRPVSPTPSEIAAGRAASEWEKRKEEERLRQDAEGAATRENLRQRRREFLERLSGESRDLLKLIWERLLTGESVPAKTMRGIISPRLLVQGLDAWQDGILVLISPPELAFEIAEAAEILEQFPRWNLDSLWELLCQVHSPPAAPTSSAGASLHADPGAFRGRRGPLEMRQNPDNGAILPGQGGDRINAERLRHQAQLFGQTLIGTALERRRERDYDILEALWHRDWLNEHPRFTTSQLGEWLAQAMPESGIRITLDPLEAELALINLGFEVEQEGPNVYFVRTPQSLNGEIETQFHHSAGMEMTEFLRGLTPTQRERLDEFRRRSLLFTWLLVDDSLGDDHYVLMMRQQDLFPIAKWVLGTESDGRSDAERWHMCHLIIQAFLAQVDMTGFCLPKHRPWRREELISSLRIPTASIVGDAGYAQLAALAKQRPDRAGKRRSKRLSAADQQDPIVRMIGTIGLFRGEWWKRYIDVPEYDSYASVLLQPAAPADPSKYPKGGSAGENGEQRLARALHGLLDPLMLEEQQLLDLITTFVTNRATLTALTILSALEHAGVTNADLSERVLYTMAVPTISDERWAQLTAHMKRLAALVAEGHSSKSMGGLLGITPRSAVIAVTRLSDAMGLEGRSREKIAAIYSDQTGTVGEATPQHTAVWRLLTPRLRQYALLASAGKTNAEIGILLGVAENTAQTTLAIVYPLLGLEGDNARLMLGNLVRSVFSSIYDARGEANDSYRVIKRANSPVAERRAA